MVGHNSPAVRKPPKADVTTCNLGSRKSSSCAQNTSTAQERCMKKRTEAATCSASETRCYPLCKSKVENTLAPLSWSSRSSIGGIGYLFLTVCLFSAL